MFCGKACPGLKICHSRDRAAFSYSRASCQTLILCSPVDVQQHIRRFLRRRLRESFTHSMQYCPEPPRVSIETASTCVFVNLSPRAGVPSFSYIEQPVVTDGAHGSISVTLGEQGNALSNCDCIETIAPRATEWRRLREQCASLLRYAALARARDGRRVVAGVHFCVCAGTGGERGVTTGVAGTTIFGWGDRLAVEEKKRERRKRYARHAI